MCLTTIRVIFIPRRTFPLLYLFALISPLVFVCGDKKKTYRLTPNSWILRLLFIQFPCFRFSDLESSTLFSEKTFGEGGVSKWNPNFFSCIAFI